MPLDQITNGSISRVRLTIEVTHQLLNTRIHVETIKTLRNSTELTVTTLLLQTPSQRGSSNSSPDFALNVNFDYMNHTLKTINTIYVLCYLS